MNLVAAALLVGFAISLLWSEAQLVELNDQIQATKAVSYTHLAVQYAARLGVAAIGHKIAGGLHLRGVGAGGTGPGLLVAAKAKAEAKGVEALKPVKAGVAVVLLAVALPVSYTHLDVYKRQSMFSPPIAQINV